jgi:hypothetical protein
LIVEFETDEEPGHEEVEDAFATHAIAVYTPATTNPRKFKSTLGLPAVIGLG